MQPTEETFTPISELGEFGLIDRMKEVLGAVGTSAVKGIGDDAAVLPGGTGMARLITVDALIEGVHFDRVFTPLKYLGFKSVAVNVSDVLAMNGLPQHGVVAIGLPNKMSVEMVDQLYAGIRLACNAYGMEIIGGDTTASPVLVLSVTVMGQAQTDALCYRSGAKAGDLLCVSGDLGSAYAGLKVLHAQKNQFEEAGESFQPNLDPFRYAVQRHLMPQARIDIIRELKKRRILPTSMIDVSDGLASEVNHLCSASGCGAAVQKETVPIREETVRVAKVSEELPIVYALHGGEDYELLFTVDAEDLDRCRGMPITVIGEMTGEESGVRLLAEQGESVTLERSGFRHF